MTRKDFAVSLSSFKPAYASIANKRVDRQGSPPRAALAEALAAVAAVPNIRRFECATGSSVASHLDDDSHRQRMLCKPKVLLRWALFNRTACWPDSALSATSFASPPSFPQTDRPQPSPTPTPNLLRARALFHVRFRDDRRL